VGFLLFTLMVKVATPILLGEFRVETPRPAASVPAPRSSPASL